MPDRPEVRLLVHTTPDGRLRLSLLDPRTGKQSPAGLTSRAGLDAEVRKVKAQLERSGLWLSSVKEM